MEVVISLVTAVAAVAKMAEINRQRSRVEEQIESRINNQNQSMNVHPALHQPDTGATVALQWRDAGDVGSMEMNVCVSWCLRE